MPIVNGKTQTRPHCWIVSDQNGMMFYNGHYSHEFMEHAHDDLTFVLVTGGAVSIVIDGCEQTVGPGELAVIGPQQIHAARPIWNEGWCMRSLQILLDSSESNSGMVGQPVGLEEPIYGPSDPLTQWFLNFHLEAEARSFEPVAEQGMYSHMQNMLEEGLSMFRVEPCGNAGDEVISEIRMLLSDPDSDNFPIQDMANQFEMSEFTLIKKFRNRFGISPHRWRLQCRANEVSRRLRTGYSLADAATSCGFSDQAHMSRTFKRVFGVTPGTFSEAFGL